MDNKKSRYRNSREVYNCHNGEVNAITKEIFCNKFREFCKFIDDCKIKDNG